MHWWPLTLTRTGCIAEAEDDGQLKEALEAAAKERSDMFDSMFQSEQKIRLGEPGWKARYYEVRPAAQLRRCVCGVTAASARLSCACGSSCAASSRAAAPG